MQYQQVVEKNLFYNTFNKPEKPIEIIHTDVVGKLENSSNDFNYYITFLDNFSRKCWGFLIKNKSNVPDIFIKFYNFISNTTPFKIIIVKHDHGRECINKNLFKFMESKGINFIHSTPGNPQQNGRAERLNQTLNNCATTLLNSAKLPLKFWDPAILCATYLYNINPHQSIENKIPNELIFQQAC